MMVLTCTTYLYYTLNVSFVSIIRYNREWFECWQCCAEPKIGRTIVVLHDVTGQAKYVYSQAITSQMCVNSPRIRVANLTYEEAHPSSSFFRVRVGGTDENRWYLAHCYSNECTYARMFITKNFEHQSVVSVIRFARPIWIFLILQIPTRSRKRI